METTPENTMARRESRLRARARTVGLQLQKRRGGDGSFPYRLVDPDTNALIHGFPDLNGYGLNLDEVEAALDE